jgi:ABC-2 type transport system permease protein
MSLGSMGLFASDIESNVISYSLTRPISRKAYTISKMITRALALIMPFCLASVITWVYTGLAFELLPVEQFIGSILPLILLLLYMGFLTDLLSSRTSTINAGFITIGILIVQFTISMLEPLEFLSPFALSSFWVEILSDPTWQFDLEILRNYLLLISWLLFPFVATIYSMEKRDL